MSKKIIAIALVTCGLIGAAQAEHRVSHNAEHTVALNKNFDINSATASEWMEVKGIGPKRAAAIIEYRKQHGNFATVSDLHNIRGISPAGIERLEQKNSIKFVVNSAA
jgi:comEA protein